MLPQFAKAKPHAASTHSVWIADLLAREGDWLRAQLPAAAKVLWIAPASAPPPPLPATTPVIALQRNAEQWLSGDLICAPAAWPVASDSLDSVVLQHLGESALAIDDLLAEAIRGLRPEGELWLFGCGPISLARLRFGRQGQHGLASTSPGRLVQALRELGAVAIERRALRQQGSGFAARASSGADWWCDVILIHARKRQSASILRPRRQQVFASLPLPPLGASPATRKALAA